jgi:hypothetical protein
MSEYPAVDVRIQLLISAPRLRGTTTFSPSLPGTSAYAQCGPRYGSPLFSRTAFLLTCLLDYPPRGVQVNRHVWNVLSTVDQYELLGCGRSGLHESAHRRVDQAGNRDDQRNG